MKADDWKNNIKDEEIDQYDYINWEREGKVIEKYSRYIGAFLIYFNKLEHELNRAISTCFADDLVHEGYLITKDLTFRNKIELFNNLFFERASFSKKKEIPIKKLKTLYNDLNSMNTFRNIIVHADWLTLDKKYYVRTKFVIDSEDGFLKGKKVKITPGMINVNLNKIEVLINKIDEIENYNYWD